MQEETNLAHPFFFTIFVLFLYFIYYVIIGNKEAEGSNKKGRLPGRRYYFDGHQQMLHALFQKQFIFYQHLSFEKQQEFLARVILFTDTTLFVPRNDIELTSDKVSIISASFVQLTFGMSKKVLKHFNYIEVYPEKFLNSYTQQYHKGDVNLQGMISISWKDFIQGYSIENDGINLGLHELAHALSMEIIKFKEHYPALFELIKPIYERAKKEVEGQMPRNLFLRDYAFTNPHEYFACATEHFFEKGEELQDGYMPLYKELSAFYSYKI